MCGFVVQFTKFGNFDLNRTSMAIAHRGPDAVGTFNGVIGHWSVNALHRRLSIIDLRSEANQPFRSEDGNVILLYNGEIYNWKELRSELENHGVSFITNSDTEVLIQGIRNFGSEFLGKINGMYAFVYVDLKAGYALAGRDSFGIKPLYVYESDDEIIFSSEIRGIEAVKGDAIPPDFSSLSEFLLNGFIYEPRTGVLGVTKVRPGHSVLISLSDEKRLTYEKIQTLNTVTNGFSDVISQVKLEAECDVPVGVFFSGGIDSSIIALAAKAKGLRCFFADYGKDHALDLEIATRFCSDNEIDIDVVEVQSGELDRDAILSSFQSCAIGVEELISDYTYFATATLSRLAREAGYKVMLSGMGADEIFGGYPRYGLAQNWSLIARSKPISNWLARAATSLFRSDKRVHRFSEFVESGDFARGYTSLVGYFSEIEVSRMVGRSDYAEKFYEDLNDRLQGSNRESSLGQAMFLDETGFLSHNLIVADKASMSESVELRVPFVSEATRNLSSSLDDRDLRRGFAGKIILRQFLHQQGMSHYFNRRKRGFNPPLDLMIRKLGREFILEIFSSMNLYDNLEKSSIVSVVNDHFSGSRNNTYRLWQLLFLTFWINSRQAPPRWR